MRPEVAFDHHSAEYAADARSINDDLLQRCPVAWSTEHGGFWVVSKHADVSAVSRDDDRFSSDHDVDGEGSGGCGISIPPSFIRAVPIELDPPEFHDYRKLLNPLFSPAAAKRWRPFIDAETDKAIDMFCERGSADLVDDLTSPVPARFTLELMGLPPDEWKFYAGPLHQLVDAEPGSDEHSTAVGGAIAMLGGITEAIADRRANPRDDLVTDLTTALIGGEPMSDQRILEILFLLIVGGVDTTTGLTTNALVWLGRNPEVRAAVAADHSLLPKAIEEFLRYFTPVQTMARTVTRDTEFAGARMQAGEFLLMNFAAANRDPALFSDPHAMQLDRSPNRHAAFGLGIHRCLGSNFARELISSMLIGALTRLPDYVVDEAAAQPNHTIGLVNGWRHAPVTFTPSAAVGASTIGRPEAAPA